RRHPVDALDERVPCDQLELYAKPNAIIMGIGLVAIGVTFGYIAYMRSKYEGLGYYTAIQEDGKEVFVKRKSKWE
ncbi:LOW QUALITY PROTEIN: small integral membrane protein 8, partial [Culex pipiens pallens]|uniref:LOW QUALITY PROTEIN: small integral membrane protein 8 n=1 Tax=Culex pipiens pallens TaxID=42434 RepID=UPI0022AA3632